MRETCLTQTELEARWNISPRTLERWRWIGDGPRFLKIGGRVIYRIDDVEAKGLATLVTGLESGSIRHDQVVDGLRTDYCRWVAPELIDVRPELNRFSAVEHSDLSHVSTAG